MTWPVLVLRHARLLLPLLLAALVVSVAPAPTGPVSLGRVRPVAMSDRDLNQRAEHHPYYARRLGHRMTRDFGWRSDRQWGCLRRLWNLESSWHVHADNRYSRAYGIPQANPGRKMSSAGAHWWRSAQTQIKWGLRYVHGRYNTPCGAWHHEQTHGWY